jgi:hypothetical protein
MSGKQKRNKVTSELSILLLQIIALYKAEHVLLSNEYKPKSKDILKELRDIRSKIEKHSSVFVYESNIVNSLLNLDIKDTTVTVRHNIYNLSIILKEDSFTLSKYVKTKYLGYEYCDNADLTFTPERHSYKILHRKDIVKLYLDLENKSRRVKANMLTMIEYAILTKAQSKWK